MLSTEVLSRIQFAFTISAHIIFPAFSIGLATFLMIMEAAWLKTKNPLYLSICKFWMKIFALTFGMGVVSGIVMEFQLGTNWSGFAQQVGSVLGGLFTYEVLTAFFIEAGFLGVMIFGWNKVGPKLHFAATFLVWLGVTLSAFWILAANSWMQTPAGVTHTNGEFHVQSWWAVIFNHSTIPRFIHMLLAAYLTTTFIIAAISAWYLLKQRHLDVAKKCFSFAMWSALILIVLQLFVGDAVGLEVHHNQPTKTAAMEGVWNTQKGAPLLLFAYPDMSQQKNLFTLSIPHLAALINTHQWNGKLRGLNAVPAKNRPFVPFVFYSFRIMVGLGVLMLITALIGLAQRFRGKLYESPWFHKLCIIMAPAGLGALWTGWITAEVGRQPWVAYHLIRTADAASPVSPYHVLITFILLFIVYGIMFGYFYFKFLGKILQHGPDKPDATLHEKTFGYLDITAHHSDKNDTE